MADPDHFIRGHEKLSPTGGSPLCTPGPGCSKADYRANRRLNLTNRGIKFIPRLDSVPESAINAIPGINEGLNLTHLARSINSLIEGIKFANKTKWSTYCQIQGGKKRNSGYLTTFP